MIIIEDKNEILLKQIGDSKVKTIIYTSVGVIGGFALGYLVGNLIVR
jgi:hypothetical protein